MDVPSILYVARPLAEALAFVHSKFVVHRDVKATNVLFASDGLRVKLSDFGSCKIFEGSESSGGEGEACAREERTYTFVGTELFMAPELLRLRPQSPLLSESKEEEGYFVLVGATTPVV